jgi:hypothetical protein
VNRAELPGHLRANLDRGQWLGGADRRDGYRDGLLDRMRRDDRDRSAAPASAIASTAASPAPPRPAAAPLRPRKPAVDRSLQLSSSLSSKNRPKGDKPTLTRQCGMAGSRSARLWACGS